MEFEFGIGADQPADRAGTGAELRRGFVSSGTKLQRRLAAFAKL
jgi:hypothetical protein